MLKRLSFWAAICLLLTAQVAAAQTAEPDTFPVEQRCIDAPTQPPSDWTYPGMILMSGYAGIHAMRADWDTPRVVAFLSSDSDGNEPIAGGQLSPDQNWYAVPMGKAELQALNNVIYSVRGLRIYSLSGGGEVISFRLDDFSNIYEFSTDTWTYYPIQWYDNETVIIGGLLLHPFSGEGETNSFDLIGWGQTPVFSPDLTRAWGSGVFSRGAFYRDFYNPLEPEKFNKQLEGVEAISWQRDSSGFMAYPSLYSAVWHGLSYYNRDGKLKEPILEINGTSIPLRSGISGRADLQWSSDNNFFVLALLNSPANMIYLVNMQARVVIDTCLTPVSNAVWSSDGMMFAYLANVRENLNLIVVDTTTWQAYIVARHSGGEMVGWRSTTNEQ